MKNFFEDIKELDLLRDLQNHHILFDFCKEYKEQYWCMGKDYIHPLMDPICIVHIQVHSQLYT